VEYVTNSVGLAYAPNVAKSLSCGSHTSKQRFLDHAKSCVQPAHSYYRRQLSSSLKALLIAFKAARLFSPMKVHVLKHTVVMIDSMTTFPFLKDWSKTGTTPLSFQKC